jgi:hypothetical protein
MASAGTVYARARLKLAAKAAKILPDRCLLIIVPGETEYSDVPCRIKSDGGNLDGAPYRIRFAWGSPAVIGATVVINAIAGRPRLTLQLEAPVDSSTSLWQEWRAKSGPAHGRQNVGF